MLRRKLNGCTSLVQSCRFQTSGCGGVLHRGLATHRRRSWLFHDHGSPPPLLVGSIMMTVSTDHVLWEAETRTCARGRRGTAHHHGQQRFPHHHRHSHQRRQMSSHVIYAVGEGWTGALGTGRIDQVIRGHFDDLEDEADDAVTMELPASMKVLDASTGWGHSAVIVSDTTLSHSPQLFLTGRPHEFASLLRLRRLPKWLRNYSSRQTLKSTNVTADSVDSSSSSSMSQLDPTSLVGRFVTYLSESFLDQPEEHWDQARMHSFLTALTHIPFPTNDHEPVSVSCSAGLTAVVTRTGHLYTLGLNQYGQCGTGHTSNNVWTPQLVTGLSSELATHGPRSELPQSSPVTQVSLGLQHVVCLNADGEVFAFGKGDRGQLGQDVATAESHTAMAIRKACHLLEDEGNKPTYVVMPKVVQVSSGMLHCALLTEEGQVFVFGKNMLPKSMSNDPKAPASDAKIPVLVRGLPSDRVVVQIASGSHHTSLLLDDGSVWGIGISSDTKEPIHEPVLLVTKDEMEDLLPVRQFAAHMDRTTIVGRDGRTVLQVHLWSDPDLREFAVFTPAWIERLLQNDPGLAIEQVHRGWIHSLVVATKNNG